MTTYKEFHRRSIEDRDGFWGEQAGLIDWNKAPEQVCDYSRPPFVKWFSGGETNLCYNAVDRHAAKRPDDNALIYISTETNAEVVYSFAQLQREVARLVARGLTNREIAGLVGSSENTVRNHLVAVYRKLDVSTRAELAGLR